MAGRAGAWYLDGQILPDPESRSDFWTRQKTGLTNANGPRNFCSRGRFSVRAAVCCGNGCGRRLQRWRPCLDFFSLFRGRACGWSCRLSLAPSDCSSLRSCLSCRRCPYSSCDCQASMTVCAGSIAALVKHIVPRLRLQIALLRIGTILSRRRFGRRMLSAPCFRRANSKPGGLRRGCPCATRWRSAHWSSFLWGRVSLPPVASEQNELSRHSIGTALSRRRIFASMPG